MTAAEDAAQWVTQQGCHNYRDERKSVPTRPSMQPVCGRSAFPLIGRTHSQPFISRFPGSKPCAFAERDSLCVAPQLSATSLSAERTFRYCHFYPLAPRSAGRQSASVSKHDRKTGSQSVSWITIRLSFQNGTLDGDSSLLCATSELVSSARARKDVQK